MSMRVKEILQIGENQLRECGIEDAAIDSKELYCYMMGIERSKLILEYQKVLQDAQCMEYFKLLDRRSDKEPLQYIVGTQDFMGLTFRTDPRALIPRQETEILVERALEILHKNSLNGNPLPIAPKKNPEVLDIGCGTGAIGLSIAKLAPDARVTCSDVSKDALSLAKENASKLGAGSVKWACGSLLEPFEGRFFKRKFDMILSNPPYIASGVIPTLQKEITEHEPMLALDGGNDGLDVYRALIPKLPEHLKKEGVVLMEIGHDQMEAVCDFLAVNGNFIHIQGMQDLAGKDRIVMAVLLSN